MQTLPGEDRRVAWSEYWSAGRLHSCTGSYDGNYSGAIGDFWRPLLQALPAGSRVLDLATGNGALPLLVAETRGNDVEVDAVDLADVSPRWHRPDEFPRIRFHSGVAMERLPFADASFDLIVSQFGFEYADREAAASELIRVAGRRGAIALVMHHAGSVLVEVGRGESASQAMLLGDHGLLDAAAAVVPWIAQARAGADLRKDAAAHRDRERYNGALRALATAIASAPVPDLLVEIRDNVQGLLAATGVDAAPASAAIAALRQALAQARLRTEEMIAQASTAAQADALAGFFAAARPDRRVQVQELRQREGVLAWAVRQEGGDDAGSGNSSAASSGPSFVA